jgi:hypothetical protein
LAIPCKVTSEANTIKSNIPCIARPRV